MMEETETIDIVGKEKKREERAREANQFETLFGEVRNRVATLCEKRQSKKIDVENLVNALTDLLMDYIYKAVQRARKIEERKPLLERARLNTDTKQETKDNLRLGKEIEELENEMKEIDTKMREYWSGEGYIEEWIGDLHEIANKAGVSVDSLGKN